jgi:hypothetical protein
MFRLSTSGFLLVSSSKTPRIKIPLYPKSVALRRFRSSKEQSISRRNRRRFVVTLILLFYALNLPLQRAPPRLRRSMALSAMSVSRFVLASPLLHAGPPPTLRTLPRSNFPAAVFAALSLAATGKVDEVLSGTMGPARTWRRRYQPRQGCGRQRCPMDDDRRNSAVGLTGAWLLNRPHDLCPSARAPSDSRSRQLESSLCPSRSV